MNMHINHYHLAEIVSRMLNTLWDGPSKEEKVRLFKDAQAALANYTNGLAVALQAPEGHCMDAGHRQHKALTGETCSCPKYVRHPSCTRYEVSPNLPSRNPWYIIHNDDDPVDESTELKDRASDV